MENNDCMPHFIEPGDDEGEMLGEPICMFLKRSDEQQHDLDKTWEMLVANAVKGTSKHD